MKRLFSAFILLSLLLLTCCTPDNSLDKNNNENEHSHVQQNQDYSQKDESTQKEEQSTETIINKPSKEEIDALAADALEVLQQVPIYPAGYPTLDDVVEHYKKATAAIGWIIGTEKVALDSADTTKKYGLSYNRVKPDCHYGEHELAHHKEELGDTEKLIYNLETLEAYLCTLINPEEVAEYMVDNKELKKFVEADNGALYAISFSYIPEGYAKDSEDKYTLIDNGDGGYTFTVDYGVLDEDGKEKRRSKESFDFIKLDGRWIFEDFRVIKQ